MLMDSTAFKEVIERQYLTRLLELTQSETISEEDSKLSAQVILGIQPFHSWEDVLMKLEFFTTKFPAFVPVLNHLQTMHDEKHTQHIIDQMHQLLREDDIDKALQVASQT